MEMDILYLTRSLFRRSWRLCLGYRKEDDTELRCRGIDDTKRTNSTASMITAENNTQHGVDSVKPRSTDALSAKQPTHEPGFFYVQTSEVQSRKLYSLSEVLDNSVDLLHVVNLFCDKKIAANISRVLRPGGKFTVSSVTDCKWPPSDIPPSALHYLAYEEGLLLHVKDINSWDITCWPLDSHPAYFHERAKAFLDSGKTPVLNNVSGEKEAGTVVPVGQECSDAGLSIPEEVAMD